MEIEGRTFIYSKIQHMIQETKKQVFDTTAVPALAQNSQRRQHCDTKGNKQI
ncbi:MAG: hypothetical protein ACXV2C_02305 [Candidatus Bathyarchaeia archaeon]